MKPILPVLSLLLAACAPRYALVSPGEAVVAGGALHVTAKQPWNRVPRGAQDIAAHEVWTANGPLLDSISFIGGVSDGAPILRPRSRDERRAPVFRADMMPPDLVSLIEISCRIRTGATLFETTSVKPASFLGQQAMRVDYRYVAADEVRRRGRAVAAIIDGKLYLMMLDGTALHYFNAALPAFDALVASARRPRSAPARDRR